jgi:hypothetical protein
VAVQGEKAEQELQVLITRYRMKRRTIMDDKNAMATKKPRAKALNEKALLVRLSIRQAGVSRVDKEVSQNTCKHYLANTDAGKFSKYLYDPKDSEILAIKQAANAGRVLHYGNSLPWKSDGWQLLPSANYTTYATAQRKAKQDFDAAVDTRCNTYDKKLKSGSFEKERKAAMGKLYSQGDYPTVEAYRSMFSYEVETVPIPDEADFRMDIAEEEIERLSAEMNEHHKKLEEVAMDDLWQRTYTVVQKLRDKCVADRKVKVNGKRAKTEIKPAIFRDTLVENIKELCQLLPKLNIKGDEKLDNMARDIERELTQASAAELRDDKKVRKQTAEKAEDILDRMGAFMGSIPKGDEQENDDEKE